jgi:hypothetical protein
LAVGHLEERVAVLDCVVDQNTPTPFDPLKAVKLFAEVLREYRCHAVTLDQFAYHTFASAFLSEGVQARKSDLTTHQCYEAFGPKLNSGLVSLVDCDKLENQFLGLIFRGAAKIDHVSGEHDDFAAAVARLVNVLSVGELRLDLLWAGGDRISAKGW